MNRFVKEVFDAHVLIQCWFSDPAAHQQAGTELLARFSPAFSMVTVTGYRLDYPALCAFFREQRGTKIGLEINVEAPVVIAENEAGAVVAYQERQQLPGQPETLRYSTVVFEVDTDGKVLWRHLHETAAANGH
ncbi:DUF4440 domain-containing protein [Rahnella perminowiae]|jgi:hypothetical protein|uniref:DUF4440 domain-containing protein n=1 Tax=Rahnella perminowiae TaxID=2816244 RepID=A0ABS6L4Y0_9GAMM|nr:MULTISPECIES: DUF4440 domain-containing protein [Rahnella]MBU9808972.1 DUF4440 domain-containing protein [Rahnella perminowiae]MBU9823617.1 DUF4440 domain-containing protein [Rahnella perminowiae]MBU9836740.1 DUF4440 domain-containing protein [Rahnella perminowiae]MCR9003596.1 DUF4440 domain-containing protein [Rahnella perminowiae]MCX2944131.1 DUF4440 domain-containing protein [Rahnella perminowiae]